MFKKSKSMASHGKTGETEFNGLFVGGSKNKKHGGKLFTVKFKLEETANMSIFTRKNSLRKEDDSSKRFSLEVIHKYLKLIKPLYIKVSKRQSEKMKQTEEFSCVSASSSPAGSLKKEKQGNIPAGIRVVCRQLGKSKSASATTGFIPATASSSSSGRRRDDSLLLQHDGIQSAILHCKNSFNSSRDSSVSSGSARDPTMISPRNSNEATALY